MPAFGKLLLVLAFGVLLPLGAASAAAPETDTAAVTVTVICAGQPAPNVMLHLFGAGGGYRFKRKVTDENGQAVFTLPVGGNYKVRANVSHRQYWSDAFQVVPGENSVTVNAGGGVLDVTLEKSAGNPLAGVDLYLFNSHGCYKRQKQTTDADGKALFTVPSGTYRLRADYLGYKFWSDAAQVDSNTAFTFTIAHKTITLTVNSFVDAPEPIQGARITLYTAGWGWKFGGWKPGHEQHDLGLSQYSDANGQVSFDLPDRKYRFRADYLSCHFWSQPFQSTDTVLDIASGEAELTVVREGIPLENIPVSLFTTAGDDTGIQRYTGADGKILFRLPARAWQFKAEYLSAAYWTPDIRLRRGVRTPIELCVGDDIMAFNLTLQKNDQEPLEGVGCYVYDADNSYTGVNGATDSQGRVRFDLREGQYKIRVDYLGYQFWSELYDVSASREDVLTIPHKDIQITVNGVFDAPQPLDGLAVRIHTASDQDVALNGTTGADGSVVFSLPDKPYLARATYLGQDYLSDPFTGQDAVVNIALGQAEVTVTGAGQVIAGAPVLAFSEDGEDLNLSAVSDAAGTVRFRLPVGAYQFRTDWLGYTFWSEAVTLTAGNVHPLDLNTGGGSFTLTLLKNETEPLTNIKCELFDSNAGQYLDLWANTDDNGQVAFNLADGAFTIRIDLPGYPLFTEAFQVPDELSKTVTIAHTDVPVTINEIHADAVPLQGVAVHLFHPDGTCLNRYLTTDDNGQVLFSLPQKDYKVRADHMGYQFWSPVFNSRPVEVNISGANAEITVKGAGRPLEGVTVSIFSADGANFGVSDHTDDQGRTLFALPAQSYTFRADYQGRQFWSNPVTLAAGRTNAVTIDTGGGTFILRVQKDAYHPLAGLQCDVYAADDRYLGISGTTDAQGKIVFNLADGQYKFKVTYMGYDFWSQVRTVPDTLAHTLGIDHRRFDILVQGINPGPVPLQGLKTDVYTSSGIDVGLSANTDADGRAAFDLPQKDYKAKVVSNGQDHWSPILQPGANLIAVNQDGTPVLPAVAAFNATLNADLIDLTWTAPADTNGLTLGGYNLYRKRACQAAFEQINSALIPADAAAYTDTQVAAPDNYIYYIAAVSDTGVEGLAGPTAVAGFAGSVTETNTAGIANLTAAWQQGLAGLSWDAQTGYTYQIFRGAAPDALSPWARSETNAYSDTGTTPYQTWYFQVATVKTVCNPATGQPTELIGPLSPVVTLAGLSAPVVTPPDLPMNAEGDYVITTGGGQNYVLEGSYSGFDGDVTVTAILGDQTITGTGAGGHFTIDLPTAGDWQITISETNGWQSLTIDTDWQVDDQPPSLTVDGPDTRSTSESQVTLTGLAADAASALQAVTAASDQYPGLTFTATLGTMGSFSAQVPLKIGDNLLTVTAADIHGNSAAKAVTVTQTLTALPVITITGPVDGAVVTTGRIDVTGTVRSSLPPGQIRLLLADQVVFAQGSGNLYTFTFTDVTLTPGSNLLTVRAETAYGNVTAQVTVQYGGTASQDQAQKPVIQVYSPLPDTFLTAATMVTGQVTGPAAITAVTVNDQPAQVAGLGSTSASFKAGLSLAGDGAPMAITITAQDAAGQSADLSYTVYADTAAPVITLANTGLQAPPAVNPVTTSPYTITGTVADANLAGLSVNDQPVALSPAADANTYSFAAGLPLTYGSDQSVAVQAWDLAGNRTGTQWIVTLESDLSIEVIAPVSGARLQGQGGTLDVAVTMRVAGASADHRFFAAADGAAAVELTRSGTVGNGTVSVATAQEDHQLNLSVQNSAGDTLAATTSTFSVQDMDAVPLSVTKLKPANGAAGIEPNDFIAVYFNKPIDPALLQIEVLETVHGKTYAAAAPGASITELSAVELVAVHRDRETVPGGIGILPGNQTAAFYPSRDLAYGAEVFVNATYDGTELLRATYNVRPLPTLLEGFVTDSATNPLAGIQVRIDGLDFSTVTNSDGAYSFGFGMDATKSLPAGRHQLIVNPGMQNSEWGTLNYWARVTQGRLSAVPAIRLPKIDPRIPFRRIVSGRADNLLADGALKLDLSAAQLTFADLRDQGDVHVQFLSVDQLPYAPMAYATPLWMFCLQPAGVKVSGQVGLTLAVPARQGGYAYLEDFGPLVVLVGLAPDALVMVPVGVGRLDADTKTVLSQGEVHLQRLDFIGYAHMPEAAQPLLQQYIDGAADLTALTAGLESLR